MVNNRGFIIHKLGYKKGRRHDYDIHKGNHPITPKVLCCMIILNCFLLTF